MIFMFTSSYSVMTTELLLMLQNKLSKNELSLSGKGRPVEVIDMKKCGLCEKAEAESLGSYCLRCEKIVVVAQEDLLQKLSGTLLSRRW